MTAVLYARCARLAILGLAALFLGACERPFIAEAPPHLEVLEPHVDTVFLDSAVPFRVRVTSFRSVARVELDGQPLEALGEDLWGGTLRMRPGVSGHLLRAVDAEGLESQDTLYTTFLPFRVEAGDAALPEGRGGHTATRLFDGRILIAGGTPRVTAPALASAVLLTVGDSGMPPVVPLIAARTGHTATRLPDGRVLLVGGSRVDSVRTRADLIETVEVFDPATLQIKPVPVVGTPIRRAFHVAMLRPSPDGPALDLFGGWTATPGGRAQVRSDVRSFAFRDDTLFARNVSFSFEEPAAGHTATPLAGASDIVTERFLLAGSYFTRGGAATASYVIDYDATQAIGIDEVGTLHTPRTRHSAAPLSGGIVFVVGGRRAAVSDVIAAPEVYADVARRFFRYPDLAPETEQSLRRFGNTATFLSSRRILLVGGYTSSGNGTSSTAYITLFD